MADLKYFGYIATDSREWSLLGLGNSTPGQFWAYGQYDDLRISLKTAIQAASEIALDANQSLARLVVN